MHCLQREPGKQATGRAAAGDGKTGSTAARYLLVQCIGNVAGQGDIERVAAVEAVKFIHAS